MGLKRRGTSKSPPIFSHEFFIQNHADIVACVAMVFVFGLMFQITSPFASMFMAVSHNLTLEHRDGSPSTPMPVMYTYGIKDLCVIFFYFLICIVMHAIVQEYVLDKVVRKLHLSKLKQSKFNESGQLLTFYLVSVIWGGDIILRENYILNISSLWEGYPYHNMTFMFKFFFVIQVCYWLHCFPELYFQKTKKDEISHRVIYATLYLALLTSAYLLNFTRVAICLLVVHYIVECVFHFSRLAYFAERTEVAKIGFTVWNGLFVFARLFSITLSVLTFWYGLALSDNQGLDVITGNFNTPTIRLNSLVAVCVVQAWMMWNFITFQLKRIRERSAQSHKQKVMQLKKEKKTRKDEAKRNYEEEMNYLPEVDQNTKKTLRKKVVTNKIRR